MSRSDNDGCLVIIVVALGMISIGAMTYCRGRYDEACHWESKMIEMSIAEWYADPKTGEKQLKYKCGEVRSEQDD